MNPVLIQLLKRFLPPSLVGAIKNWRKNRRQLKRFRINDGKDLLRQVEIFGYSFSIYINPYLNGGVDDVIYETGVWEPEIAELIKLYVPLGGVFVDIGANIGFHSLFAASVVGNEGLVMSFEPLPRLQQQMISSVNSNNFKQIRVEPVALGYTSGKAILSLVEENIGASSIQNVTEDRAVGSTIEVPVRTLDSYLDILPRVNLIKIDIEGSEFEALKGAETLLRKTAPVIILEFSPHVYEKDYTGKSLALFDYLNELGYVITDIENKETDVKGCLQAGKLAELHTNLLCVPAVS